MKTKITFLLGAGAEVSFNILSGEDFAKNLIKHDKNGSMEKAIQQHFSNKVKEIDLGFTDVKKWYPSYRIAEFADQTLLRNSVEKIKANSISYFLNDDKVSNLIELVSETAEKFNDEAVKLGLLTYIDKKYFLTEDGWNLVTQHPNYMGMFDERFYTLINPNGYGPYKFWSVITIYTKAYLSMVKGFLKPNKDSYFDEIEFYKEILKNPIETYQKIRDSVDGYVNEKNDSYYKILRELKEKIDIRVITANYTPLIERFLNNDLSKSEEKTNIAYIHGKLNWFESSYMLEVYDVEEKGFDSQFESDILFPYIFIQSGVKPIVEKRQLLEYNKALSMLDDDIDKLVVLGYAFNHDDNHLNSIIRDFIKRKPLVYFHYVKEDDFNTSKESVKEDILKKLRISNDQVNSIEVVIINNSNCFDIFSEMLGEDN